MNKLETSHAINFDTAINPMEKLQSYYGIKPLSSEDFSKASEGQLTPEECQTLLFMASVESKEVTSSAFGVCKKIFDEKQQQGRKLMRKLKEANNISSTFALGFALGRLVEDSRLSDKLKHVSNKVEHLLSKDASVMFFGQHEETIH